VVNKPGLSAEDDHDVAARKDGNRTRAVPLGSKGFPSPSGRARRSATTHTPAGLCPKPLWLPITWTHSLVAEGISRQACQGTMPSWRVKMAVAGTGSGPRSS